MVVMRIGNISLTGVKGFVIFDFVRTKVSESREHML
jgi:hypothetical protein